MPDRDRDPIQNRLDLFVDTCRQKGLKVTPQRLEIFRELASTSEHPTAEELLKRIKTRMPTVSLDTVYRTLTTLQEYGMVNRVEVLDDRSRFDANLDPHHHFVCIQCKKVQDFNWSNFDQLRLPTEVRKWGKVHQLHAELRGLCRECLAHSRESGSPGPHGSTY